MTISSSVNETLASYSPGVLRSLAARYHRAGATILLNAIRREFLRRRGLTE